MTKASSSMFALFLCLSVLSAPAVADVQDIEVDAEIPQAQVEAKPGYLEIKVGKSTYRVEDPKAGESDRAAYETLSDGERLAFDTNRRVFIGVLARGLHFMKYGMGIGSITKEKIKYHVRKLKPTRVLNWFRPGREEAQIVAEENAAVTLRERSEQVIGGMLKGIDRKLWLQAPLFARSNEFGIVTAGGLEMITGTANKGLGGLVDLGVSIGYNRDDRSLAIQIFVDYERYKNSVMPALFLAGAVGKAGIYIANQKSGELKHEGISYYPPMAPAYTSVTKDNFMTGFSSGLTWPPSPIGDMLTYTDKLDQTMLIRVSVSPFTKGFVRMGTGITPKDIIRIVVSPVKAIIPAILRLVRRKETCEDRLSQASSEDKELQVEYQQTGS